MNGPLQRTPDFPHHGGSDPMTPTETLREHALSIWTAGVEAVKPDVLMRRAVTRAGDRLVVGQREFDLGQVRKIAVVGAGKASAAMAGALEAVLGDELLREKQVEGWVNVPADCVRPLKAIHAHAARPAGVNEPTEAGVEGSERVLQLVSQLGADDVLLCLISGGGSALLPSPAGVTLEEKQQVTRFLSAAGANINELNAVRKRLSRIKGGGLARASNAGSLVSLIISDVIGDPLDMIASGPTAENHTTFAEARAILEKYRAAPPAVSQTLLGYLADRARETNPPGPFPTNVSNFVIGNNSMTFPERSIMLPNSTVTIPKKTLGADSATYIWMLDQDSQLVATTQNQLRVAEASSNVPTANVTKAQPKQTQTVATTPTENNTFAFADTVHDIPTNENPQTKVITHIPADEVQTQTAAVVQSGSALPKETLPMLGLIGIISMGLLGVYAGKKSE